MNTLHKQFYKNKKEFFLKMKKINYFSVNDIVRKRRFNNKSKKQQNILKQNQQVDNTLQSQQNQDNQDQIIRKIVENINSKISITNLMKNQMLQIIGRKINLSLNSNNILPKMKIRKVQYIQIIEKYAHKNNLQSKTNLVYSKKLDQNGNLANKTLDKRKSYFILSGSMHKYKKSKQKTQLIKKKQFFDQQLSNQTIFCNYQQLQKQYPQFQRVTSFNLFTGFGFLFQLNKEANNSNIQKDNKNIVNQKFFDQSNHINKQIQLLVADQAIFVQIQSPQFQNQYINLSGMNHDKILSNIQKFIVFKPLGKKIRNFSQYFQFKQYKKNQQIYSIGDLVHKFYLILKGQIVFQQTQNNLIRTATTTPKQSKKNSFHLQFPLKTETLSAGNYFGQEQILLECSQRFLSATCKSSKCQILQICKQKFQRMLDYSDFYQSIKKSAQLKYQKRQTKLQKNKIIRNKFVFTQFNEQKQDENNKTMNLVNSKSNVKNDRKTTPSLLQKSSFQNRFKVMHGNVIRQFSNDKNDKDNQQIKFSMLYANPDMYEKTLKKFRKFNIKTPQKYKPQINWDLKRVWRVLNLQSVLRQQAEVGSSEGRKYYDSHKRYLFQINESKSFRPKTSSSTYRTKLQYIAYLQQFKSQNN